VPEYVGFLTQFRPESGRFRLSRSRRPVSVELAVRRKSLLELTARPEVKTGLWVWSERDCTAGQVVLSLGCSQPEMPQYQDQLEPEGVCLLRHE